MKQIRQQVFETNSSSTHSITIAGNLQPSIFIPICWNKIETEFGKYGWGPETLISQHDRLSYLVTMWWELEGKNEQIESIFKTPGWKLINDSIAKYCNCNGIYLKSGNLLVEDIDGEVDFRGIGYVNHQNSIDDYKDIQDFLKSNQCTVEEFVFKSGNEIKIENDNM